MVKFSKLPWWLVIGALAHLGAFLRGALSSFGVPFSEVIYGLIDWLAATVIYFFYGALIGHLIDWWRAKKQKKTIQHPWWIYFSLGFWVLSASLSFILVGATSVEEFFLYLFFPVTFGIFLPAFGFDLLLPGLIARSPWSKIALDIVFLGMFATWLSALLLKKELLQKIFLIAIFVLFLLGLGGCLSALA